MNEREELRMIRERIVQNQEPLAAIEAAAARAARMLGVLAALACGAMALLFIAALALLRLAARAG